MSVVLFQLTHSIIITYIVALLISCASDINNVMSMLYIIS